MEIDKLIKIATMNKNEAAKEAYRAIKQALLLDQTSKNPTQEGSTLLVIQIPDEKLNFHNIHINERDFKIISKLIKQREESIAIFEANNRYDLSDKEKEQLAYLKILMPKPVSEEKIIEYVNTAYPNGFTQKEMGRIIKEVKSVYPTAEGKIISKIIKSFLSNE